MQLHPIHTRTLTPPQDDLLAVLNEAITDLPEQSIIVISSKVVAIWQGRCTPIPHDGDPLVHKDVLAQQDAELFIPRDADSDEPRMHTIKHGVLIGSAGIDESNGNGYYVHLPDDPMRAAAQLRAHLKERTGVTDLGVIISDSHSTPLRNGATGVSLGYAGFKSQYDYRGTADIFGRAFAAERLNVADGLAAAANLVMGEGAETTPLVRVADAPHVVFTETEAEDPWLQLRVPMEDDLFRRFLQSQPWQKGGSSDTAS